MIDNPKAKYKLIGPNWRYLGAEGKDMILGYEDGKGLLITKAKEYQMQQIDLFESQNKKS